MSSAHGFPPRSPSPGSVASERRSLPTWWVVCGTALIIAVGAVATVVAVQMIREPSPLNGERLLRAPARPMPPQEQRHSGYDLPVECGVSTATLDRVVPKRPDDEGATFAGGTSRRCSWRSEHDGDHVVLTVEIDTAEGLPKGSMGRFSDRMKSLPREARVKTVAQLGDEAYAHYHDAPEGGDGEATIVLRAGDAVAKVKLLGSGDGPDLESKLMVTTLQVTMQVAEKLGVPETGKATIAPPPSGVAVSVSAREPICSAISRQTQRLLIGRPYTSPGPFGSPSFRPYAPVHDNPRMDTCSWAGDVGTVRVETMTLAHSPEGADAQAARTLDWLQWRTRTAGISHAAGAGAAALFALTGHGDGGFAAHEPPSSRARGGYGLVAFRIHNAVIRVTYTAAFKRQLTQDQAVNGAYTAAVDVAATFKP